MRILGAAAVRNAGLVTRCPCIVTDLLYGGWPVVGTERGRVTARQWRHLAGTTEFYQWSLNVGPALRKYLSYYIEQLKRDQNKPREPGPRDKE